MDHPGKTLKQAIEAEKPLQIVGVINAYTAKLAESAGFSALYLSGAGVANGRFGLPDLGMTSLNDVLQDVENITNATALPLLVDADTGWGSPLNVRRTFRLLERAGAAGAHIEDQHEAKRCGHRDGKLLIDQQKMLGRIKAALDGRCSDKFMVMARTDALASEGEDRTLERALAYEAAGADALFLEAVTTLEQYQTFTKALRIPVLANITEFGKTPLFSKQALAKVNISMILYPLSAFRAMNAAALKVFNTIRQEGTQESVVNIMQTRQDLYQVLNYDKFEAQVEEYFTILGEE